MEGDITLNVSIDYANLDRNLQAMVTKIPDNKPWMRRAGDSVYEILGDVFDTGKSVWPPLSEPYKLWKSKIGYSTKTLVKTGALRASLSGPAAPGSYYVLRDNMLTIGSNIRVGRHNLAILHQLSTEKMPARPILTRETDDKIIRAVNASYAEELRVLLLQHGGT